MKILFKYKSVLSHIKDIKERNRVFDSLDDKTKRREVCWDALQLVLNDSVRAAAGIYWSGSIEHIDGDSKELQEELNYNLPHCRVCARGAVMLSTIRLGNSIDASSYGKNNGINRYGDSIAKGFSTTTLLKMENIYENWITDESEDFKRPDLEERSELMLANVLCNVIVNGDYNTEDDTIYVKDTLKTLDKIKLFFK